MLAEPSGRRVEERREGRVAEEKQGDGYDPPLVGRQQLAGGAREARWMSTGCIKTT